jgi:molecular chaperone GrpE
MEKQIDEKIDLGVEGTQDFLEQMRACQEKLITAEEKYAYLLADFDNFRRRTDKDRGRWIDSAKKDVIKEILVIVDDFDRAFTEIERNVPSTMAQYFSGFKLIYKQFTKILSAHNVEEITEVGVFNPELHEAIMHVADAEKAPGEIVAVLQKGYKIKGEVIRPAQVSVAQE